ncbi:MAG: Fic family protein [bacterium]|nr:Fic family protein [bacterium]
MKIKEFLQNVKLDDSVKKRLSFVWEDIEQYIEKLSHYNKTAQEIFLRDYLFKENVDSSKLERTLYSPAVEVLYDEGAMNETKINEELIKLLNASVRCNDKILDRETFEKIREEKNKDITYQEYVKEEKSNLSGNYRMIPVWIGDSNGINYAVHIPPAPEEIETYMKEFVEYYNNLQGNELDDPIVKSALIHVLFIKIHPFSNGNGRCARILLNKYLKTAINIKYDKNFKYPIINLSKSFDLTRLTYFDKQNAIRFKNDIDNNEAINAWIKYIIMMIGEQLYYLNNRLDSYHDFLSSLNDKSFKIN